MVNLMREILFRGKVESALNVDEWVYGFLVNARSRFNGELRTYIQTIKENGELDLLRAVDPETVGQYTGLTDKNGTKIFEGDIVNVITETTRYVVKFDEWRCGWYPFASGDGCGCCEMHTYPPNYAEVIGNIHDNPELLKGDDYNA